jgi:hypothetical protein
LPICLSHHLTRATADPKHASIAAAKTKSSIAEPQVKVYQYYLLKHRLLLMPTIYHVVIIRPDVPKSKAARNFN